MRLAIAEALAIGLKKPNLCIQKKIIQPVLLPLGVGLGNLNRLAFAYLFYFIYLFLCSILHLFSMVQ